MSFLHHLLDLFSYDRGNLLYEGEAGEFLLAHPEEFRKLAQELVRWRAEFPILYARYVALVRLAIPCHILKNHLPALTQFLQVFAESLHILSPFTKKRCILNRRE